MKKIIALCLLFFASSCAVARGPAGAGWLFTEDVEVIYYDPYIVPKQRATMCSTNYFGLFSQGDSSFSALKLGSTIRKISTMERTYSSRLGIYSESCLVVKGE